ncbi:aminotransferase class V-fold PLP-dependent enzyme [Plantactinospora sp. S1510]|uniref:Aminotransferase class V-fold PLP-dependent enzyme n=1 Tax=Plantactinospora alkalitolerans TaxID=2789879 RepID=A0ABS0GUK0_9ACTN|nr:aminotransferase class V-fold PLP-dependent enzyme [Plantactinospora alkalitolerans]MBF9129892.1 aminotransferase class V-fold PLP-dependent enzyme [Plantactinospora alkalitolerans]
MSAAGPQPPVPIPGARLLFSLDPGVAHLNHGSYGAVPIGVQRTQQRLRDETEANPMRFFNRGLVDRITHARRHLAGFLGADPDGTALIGNVSIGAAIVLQSLRLEPGDEVVCTDHGYGSFALTVDREVRRTGAVRRTLPVPLDATDEEIIEIVRSGIRAGRTKLLLIDQLTSSTARLFPASAIVAAARERGIPVLVDGAHAPGMLPSPVDTIGADFWVGNLHKWAYAPRGTAALVVAPRWRERIEPLAVSWYEDAGFPTRVEWQATLDYTAWLAAPVGLFTLRTLGLERVRAHNAALAAYGQWVVGRALGIAPADLRHPGGPTVAMRLLPLPAGTATTFDDAMALRERVGDELGAEVAINAWQGRGWLRLSGQVYNRAEEYERLAERLPALLATLS